MTFIYIFITIMVINFLVTLFFLYRKGWDEDEIALCTIPYLGLLYLVIALIIYSNKTLRVCFENCLVWLGVKHKSNNYLESYYELWLAIRETPRRIKRIKRNFNILAYKSILTNAYKERNSYYERLSNKS